MDSQRSRQTGTRAHAPEPPAIDSVDTAGADALDAVRRLRSALDRLADERTHAAVSNAVAELRRHPERQTPAQQALLRAFASSDRQGDEELAGALTEAAEQASEPQDAIEPVAAGDDAPPTPGADHLPPSQPSSAIDESDELIDELQALLDDAPAHDAVSDPVDPPVAEADIEPPASDESTAIETFDDVAAPSSRVDADEPQESTDRAPAPHSADTENDPHAMTPGASKPPRSSEPTSNAAPIESTDEAPGESTLETPAANDQAAEPELDGAFMDVADLPDEPHEEPAAPPAGDAAPTSAMVEPESREEFDTELADDLERLLEGDFNPVDVVIEDDDGGSESHSDAESEPDSPSLSSREDEARPSASSLDDGLAPPADTPTPADPSATEDDEQGLDLDAMPELAPDDPEDRREGPSGPVDLPGEAASVDELLSAAANDGGPLNADGGSAATGGLDPLPAQGADEKPSLETPSTLVPDEHASDEPEEDAPADETAVVDELASDGEEFSIEEMEAIDGSDAFDDDTEVRAKTPPEAAAAEVADPGTQLGDPADGLSAMEIDAAAERRARGGLERAAINALGVVNQPFERLPSGMRTIVEWIALTLVFWAPIVWAIALLKLG